eukprot:gnl/MRDRNA2_/MRDRNA2_105360_c0_seq1.p1 gnl/MRDRNA2_/MRDRNA2_105360_c0~~gnl/MRDRNA2_/MRDRNA2_105360_c0_seq1.p1  ORF type:complete len:162 (+),score=39.14 gnl/MRDRNA2_/MRDRNA2_105360_c0_seq1:180-665(+)
MQVLSTIVLLLAIFTGEAVRYHTRKITKPVVRKAQQKVAAAKAASSLKVKGAHSHPKVPSPLSEMVLTLLGNTEKRGADMLREELSNLQQDSSKHSALTKDLTNLLKALKAPDTRHEQPIGMRDLDAGIAEYRLDPASSKAKVASMLSAVFPEAVASVSHK